MSFLAQGSLPFPPSEADQVCFFFSLQQQPLQARGNLKAAAWLLRLKHHQLVGQLQGARESTSRSNGRETSGEPERAGDGTLLHKVSKFCNILTVPKTEYLSAEDHNI